MNPIPWVAYAAATLVIRAAVLAVRVRSRLTRRYPC